MSKRTVYMHERHDVTRSAKLEDYRECLHAELEGTRADAATPAAREAQVRRTFTRAAERCSRKMDRGGSRR